MPDVDVARAGGWKSTVSLKSSYQQADAETTLRVVLGAGELWEASEPPNVHTNVHTLFSAGVGGNGESVYLRDGSSTEGP